MKRIFAATACATGLCATVDLSTNYKADHVLVVETSITLESKVTNFEVLIDGQAPEGRELPGEQSSTLTVSTLHADHIVEASDGSPTMIRREFRSLSANNVQNSGGEENSNDLSSPLEDVTLEIKSVDGEISVRPTEEKDLEKAQLEGHLLALSIDALLPEEEIEEGGSWELESEAIAEALGFQRQATLFPRRQGGGREAAGGEGRRGQRGRQRGAGQGGGLGEFAHLNWEGEAQLAGTEDYEGTSCWVIELELEASGELPEQAQGQGRRRRDRSVQPETSLPSTALETTMEIELKGRMLVSVDGRHPMNLSLEGSFEREMERNVERGERSMEMTRSSEGNFKLEVAVSQEESE